MYNFRDNYYAGLSGLQVPVPKYRFPPPYEDVSRLTYYSLFFNSIEINSSFYKVPMAKTVANWSGMVNEHFTFTFKLWKEITHGKNLVFKKGDVAVFMKHIAAVGDKKAALLVQLPPSTGSENTQHLTSLLDCIRDIDPDKQWKIAVEFRNTSWYNDQVYRILDNYYAALVIQDIPKSSTPLVESGIDFIYLRFHGPTGNYRDSYTDAFLDEYAGYIDDWINNGKTVYAYFNNTMGEAFKNLEILNRHVQERR